MLPVLEIIGNGHRAAQLMDGSLNASGNHESLYHSHRDCRLGRVLGVCRHSVHTRATTGRAAMKAIISGIIMALWIIACWMMTA